MSILTKDQIRKVDDRKAVSVDVTKWWGGSVNLRSLKSVERDAFEDSVYKGKTDDLKNLRARFVALCLVDESGERLFTQDKEIRELGSKNAECMDFLFDKARELNGMRREDVEGMAKN